MAEHDTPEATFGELFIGLVGPIGADLNLASELLERALKSMKLKGPAITPIRIKIIETVHQVRGFETCKSEPEEKRITHHMNLGDRFRQRLGMGDGLVLNAIRLIQIKHRRGEGDKKPPRQNTVYLFKSLKHPEEIQRLRETYGKSFFLISCYMSEEERRSSLRNRISNTHPHPPKDLDKIVTNLLERDYDDKLTKYGQKVSDSFHLADVFVDISDEERAKAQFERFVKILFSHPYVTPTVDEFAMFHAKAAAFRSADLSRQVGAVICNSSGAIIATGMNEVPMAGGGTYAEESKRDYRDYRQGHDSSSKWKRKILFEILSALKQEKWLADQKKGLASDKILDEFEKLLKIHDCRVVRLIEFLRPVHAEMAALMDAARRGVPVQGGTLFCTTFPCHECARLIVAAGIMRVVYIEPYPKSAAVDLYSDSIIVEPSTENLMPSAAGFPRVLFQPFVGVAPRLYIQVFDASQLERKDKRGSAIDWESKPAELRFKDLATTYIPNEESALKRLDKRIESMNLRYRK